MCLLSRKSAHSNPPISHTPQVGPFVGNGLNFKGSGILAIYRFPTASASNVLFMHSVLEHGAPTTPLPITSVSSSDSFELGG